MSVIIARRPAFPIGHRVQWHPSIITEVDERRHNDRGTVLACVPSVESPRLDIVTVLWDSKVAELTEGQLDRPCSAYGQQTVSTRLTVA